MADWHLALGGASKKQSRAARLTRASRLFKERSGDATKLLDHHEFNALTRSLSLPSEAMTPPVAPRGPADGVVCGWLLHQGKFRGDWKRAWFVLQPPYLFQYASDRSAKPKSALYVSFSMAEKLSADELDDEVGEHHMTALEEKACSLRINVYTPSKLKVLTAPSEQTLRLWVEQLQLSVQAHNPTAALDAKQDAAERLRPLLMAQLLSEVDTFVAMRGSRREGGALKAEADPRLSPHVARAGKLKVLRTGGIQAEHEWSQFYVVLLHSFLYYFKEDRPGAEGDEEEGGGEADAGAAADAATRELPWKGCINLTYATVGPAPEDVSKKARVFQLTTPLRTFIFKARHEVDAEEWMAQICHAQRGTPPVERAQLAGGFDVHADPLAKALAGSGRGGTETSRVLAHPVGRHLFREHLGSVQPPVDPSIWQAVETLDAIEEYGQLVVPQLKMKKAEKIYREHIATSTLLPPEHIAAIGEQTAAGGSDFAAEAMFGPIEGLLHEALRLHFDGFRAAGMVDRDHDLLSISATFTYDGGHFSQVDSLSACLGPKLLSVSRPEDASYPRRQHALAPGSRVMVGRADPREDGRTFIQLWQEGDDGKVSREHCRLDVGPLAVLVTDLGSSKGTRLHARDGPKLGLYL